MQLGAHRFQEILKVQRLLKDSRVAKLSALLLRVGETSDHERRNRAPDAVTSLTPEELPAVHDGHVQIDNDDVNGLTGPEIDERVAAVGRVGDDVPFGLEKCR